MDNVSVIALSTFRELVRSKVLYIVLFFAVALVAVCSLFGTVTIGSQVLIVKDFGLFSVSIFSIGFAVIAGSSLLHKELSRKTIYTVLSKPVKRWQFILGKYFGILLTSSLMLVLMGAGLAAFLSFFNDGVDSLLLVSFFYSILELAIVCASAIFFSTVVVTPILNGLFTFGFFLAGRSVEYLLYFVRDGSAEGVPLYFSKGLYCVLPHLNELNVANEIVYGRAPSLHHLIFSSLYVVGYCGVLLIIAQIFFEKREFN